MRQCVPGRSSCFVWRACVLVAALWTLACTAQPGPLRCAVCDRAIRGRYIELDLYVPEYVEADEQLRKKPWYPLLKRLGGRKVLLVERGEGSYILLLRRGLKPAPAGGG